MTTQLLSPIARVASGANEPDKVQHPEPIARMSQSMNLEAPGILPRLSAIEAQHLVGVVGV